MVFEIWALCQAVTQRQTQYLNREACLASPPETHRGIHKPPELFLELSPPDGI